jgi:hypothetical protein
MGRPHKAPEDRLSVGLPFRVTETEGDVLMSKARKKKLSISKYLRLRLRELGIFDKED